MAKFKVGDRARFIKRHPKATSSSLPLGAVVTIIGIGPILTKRGTTDYRVEHNGTPGGCDEWQLEPIIELGEWSEIEESIGWNPTKQLEGV